MNIIRLQETDSTNSWVSAHAPELPSESLVIAHTQTAGRGQRGNTWESEPGKNLTFTLLMRLKAIPAIRQFRISQAVSIAICDTLEELYGVHCRIKWPNDIYAGDRKICGILISHSLTGSHIDHTIIGGGINVNQTIFRSDAPNPVSVAQLTGRTYNLDELTEAVGEKIIAQINAIDHAFATSDERAEGTLDTLYMSMLWRADGKNHPFRRVSDNSTFMASIQSVQPTGHITLLHHPSNTTESFAFKEIEWLNGNK